MRSSEPGDVSAGGEAVVAESAGAALAPRVTANASKDRPRPQGAFAENIEFFLTSAIVIVAIRTFFVQPMVIPTNSMWPSYYGLTAQTYTASEPPPALPMEAWRFVTRGAVPKSVAAPRAGEISVPIFFDAARQPHFAYSIGPGRRWGIIPTTVAAFTFWVGGEPATLSLPVDFHDFDQVFMRTYFPNPSDFDAAWQTARDQGRIRPVALTAEHDRVYEAYVLPLGRTVQAGEPLIRFDLLHGDMVLVDRLSYHFLRPKVGDAFVFETGLVPGLVAMGEPDQYFIKRLVGVPGDRLEIKPPALYRNGRPIEGAKAFDAMARRERLYPGYVNELPGLVTRYLRPGEVTQVPPRSYMALGDNSPDSEDSRIWGFVPEAAVTGRALFIYYPFTRRWGLAD